MIGCNHGCTPLLADQETHSTARKRPLLPSPGYPVVYVRYPQGRFVNVAKHDVADFMEKGFHRESRNWVERDPPATLRVTLGVAVQVLERYTLDVQRGKRGLFIWYSTPSVCERTNQWPL